MFKRHPGDAAVNLSTSRLIDDLAARAGQAVHRTAVGEANVAQAVIEKKCVIGGEGNGGVIDPRVVCVRDSLVGMALVLNLLSDAGRALSDIVDDMPRYVMVKRKLELDRKHLDAWLGRIRESAARQGAAVNDTDGLRLDWPDRWVHVRPSNTEPIARVIAEARDEASAQALAQQVIGLR
jgi:phosphomannomutase